MVFMTDVLLSNYVFWQWTEFVWSYIIIQWTSPYRQFHNIKLIWTVTWNKNSYTLYPYNLETLSYAVLSRLHLGLGVSWSFYHIQSMTEMQKKVIIMMCSEATVTATRRSDSLMVSTFEAWGLAGCLCCVLGQDYSSLSHRHSLPRS